MCRAPRLSVRHGLPRRLVESISVSSSYGERNILREVPFPSWVPALLQGQVNMLEFIVTTASANYAASQMVVSDLPVPFSHAAYLPSNVMYYNPPK